MCFLCVFAALALCRNVFADSALFVIENASIVNKSANVEGGITNIDSNSIHNNAVFYEAGGSITYKVLIRNKSKIERTIEGVTAETTSRNIAVEYNDYNGEKVAADGTFEFLLKVVYKDDSSSTNDKSTRVKIAFKLDGGENASIVIMNPSTWDNITVFGAILAVSIITLFAIVILGMKRLGNDKKIIIIAGLLIIACVPLPFAAQAKSDVFDFVIINDAVLNDEEIVDDVEELEEIENVANVNPYEDEPSTSSPVVGLKPAKVAPSEVVQVIVDSDDEEDPAITDTDDPVIAGSDEEDEDEPTIASADDEEPVLVSMETVFEQSEPCVFDGPKDSINGHTISGCEKYTDVSYIDTEIKLFNKDNFEKDFLVSFTIDEFDLSKNGYRPTFMSSTLEVGSLLYPGFVARRDNTTSNILIGSNTVEWKDEEHTGLVKTDALKHYYPAIDVKKISFMRKGGVICYQINDDPIVRLHEQPTNNQYYFDTTVSFGASYEQSGKTWRPERFFVGTMSNMIIKLGTDGIGELDCQ